MSQTTASDQPARWQPQHASALGIPRVGHEAHATRLRYHRMPALRRLAAPGQR